MRRRTRRLCETAHDAFRIAHVELIEWLAADYGFGKLDAYALLGQRAGPV